jgi:hypothetical protein
LTATALPVLRLREPLGERNFSAAQLPITLGGVGNQVIVPGVLPGTVLALIGVHDGQLFWQPQVLPGKTVGDAAPPESEWLHPGARYDLGEATLVCLPGDPPCLEIYHAADNRTMPPTSIADGADLDAEAKLAVPRVLFQAPDGSTPDTAIAPSSNKRSRWGLAAVLAAGLAFTLLAMQGVSISVNTQPAAARVEFLGSAFAPRVAGRYWLWPGRYELQVAQQGYAPYRAKIDISDRGAKDFHVNLQKLPGTVQLLGLPAGSVVSWDGVPQAAGEFRSDRAKI